MVTSISTLVNVLNWLKPKCRYYWERFNYMWYKSVEIQTLKVPIMCKQSKKITVGV